MKQFLMALLATPLLLIGQAGCDAGEKPAPKASAVSKNISVEDAAKLVKENKAIVILDVRTPEEFKAGHIPGATNVDFNDPAFSKQLAQLDRNKTYLVHCAAGGRSAQANEEMQVLKFKSILHMNEGFRAWAAKGKPVER